jgi:hypothetical protein
VLLFTVDGLQFPVIPFVDVDGKDGTDPLVQIVSDVPKLNAGVITGFTVTASKAVKAHWPASGVKV